VGNWFQIEKIGKYDIMSLMEMIIDGYHINYKVTGDGPKTFVILQGWGTNCELYDIVAKVVTSLNEDAEKEKQYKVIQFDLPGFGRSDEPREAWDVDAYTDFFVQFMKELGIANAVLFGHSYGGRIIIKLLNRSNLPFAVDKIILNDAAGIMPKRTAKQNFKVKRYKVLKKFLLSKPIHAMFPDMIDYWKSQQGSADYRAASAMMKQCLVKAVNEDLTELLPNIKQDTLLIWGDNDTATPLSDGKTMEELIPNSGLVVFEGAGHYSFLEKPQLFNQVLTSYLK